MNAWLSFALTQQIVTFHFKTGSWTQGDGFYFRYYGNSLKFYSLYNFSCLKLSDLKCWFIWVVLMGTVSIHAASFLTNVLSTWTYFVVDPLLTSRPIPKVTDTPETSIYEAGSLMSSTPGKISHQGYINQFLVLIFVYTIHYNLILGKNTVIDLHRVVTPQKSFYYFCRKKLTSSRIALHPIKYPIISYHTFLCKTFRQVFILQSLRIQSTMNQGLMGWPKIRTALSL